MVNPINFRMASHPVNWFVVLLMLVIAGSIGHLALSLVAIEPATKDTYSNLPAGQTAQTA